MKQAWGGQFIPIEQRMNAQFTSEAVDTIQGQRVQEQKHNPPKPVGIDKKKVSETIQSVHVDLESGYADANPHRVVKTEKVAVHSLQINKESPSSDLSIQPVQDGIELKIETMHPVQSIQVQQKPVAIGKMNEFEMLQVNYPKMMPKFGKIKGVMSISDQVQVERVMTPSETVESTDQFLKQEKFKSMEPIESQELVQNDKTQPLPIIEMDTSIDKHKNWKHKKAASNVEVMNESIDNNPKQIPKTKVETIKVKKFKESESKAPIVLSKNVQESSSDQDSSSSAENASIQEQIKKLDKPYTKVKQSKVQDFEVDSSTSRTNSGSTESLNPPNNQQPSNLQKITLPSELHNKPSKLDMFGKIKGSQLQTSPSHDSLESEDENNQTNTFPVQKMQIKPLVADKVQLKRGFGVSPIQSIKQHLERGSLQDYPESPTLFGKLKGEASSNKMQNEASSSSQSSQESEQSNESCSEGLDSFSESFLIQNPNLGPKIPIGQIKPGLEPRLIPKVAIAQADTFKAEHSKITLTIIPPNPLETLGNIPSKDLGPLKPLIQQNVPEANLPDIENSSNNLLSKQEIHRGRPNGPLPLRGQPGALNELEIKDLPLKNCLLHKYGMKYYMLKT